MDRRVSLHRSERTRLDERLWLVAVLFFGIGDVATTGVGLSVAGVSEAAPVVALLLRQSGIGAFVLLKLALFCGCYLAWRTIPRPHRVGVPLGLALLGVAVTIWNFRVLTIALSP